MEQAPSLRSGGPWRSGWRRLRRDRGGFMALVVVVALLILALFGSAVASRLVGHDGNTTFIYAAGGNKPVGPYLLYAVLDPRVGLERGEQRTKSLVGGVF